jgi:hypothetical protein
VGGKLGELEFAQKKDVGYDRKSSLESNHRMERK